MTTLSAVDDQGIVCLNGGAFAFSSGHACLFKEDHLSRNAKPLSPVGKQVALIGSKMGFGGPAPKGESFGRIARFRALGFGHVAGIGEVHASALRSRQGRL